MAVYPRYTREENKSCKLTLDQIEEIQSLYVPWKFWYRKIAKKMNLPQSTVRYRCISSEERKSFNRIKVAYNKKPSKEEVKRYNSDRKKRKWEDFLNYESELKKEYLKKPWVRERRRKYMAWYYKKNPDKVNPKKVKRINSD